MVRGLGASAIRTMSAQAIVHLGTSFLYRSRAQEDARATNWAAASAVRKGCAPASIPTRALCAMALTSARAVVSVTQWAHAPIPLIQGRTV